MRHVLEIEAEDAYNYVEYKIIIRNARKVKIRLFLTHLLLKWAKKSISGNHDYRGKYRFPHRIEEQKMSKDLEREIKSLRDQLENLKKFYKSVVDAQVSVFKFLMRVEERVKSIEQKTRIK